MYALALLVAAALAQEPQAPAARAPDARLLRVGPIESLTVLELAPEYELELQRCLPEHFEERLNEASGSLELRIQLTGHKARAITVAEADPSLQPLAPCFVRTLAEVRWAERAGAYRVPIAIGRERIIEDAIDPPVPAWAPDRDDFEPAPRPRDTFTLDQARELTEGEVILPQDDIPPVDAGSEPVEAEPVESPP